MKTDIVIRDKYELAGQLIGIGIVAVCRLAFWGFWGYLAWCLVFP